MKKIFLSVCFILVASSMAMAKMTEINDQAAIPQAQAPNNENPAVRTVPQTALELFLAERIQAVVFDDPQKIKTGSINTVRSMEFEKALEESKKPEFQKIYESALEKVSQPRQRGSWQPATATPSDIDAIKKDWGKPNFPVIEAILPDSPSKVLVPAQEHIPYLMTKIDVLPDGVVKFEETLTVVSNAEKLRQGIRRALPASILLRDRSKQPISYTLVSAKVNGQPIEYRIDKEGGFFVLNPTKEYELSSGVYTFEFVYLAHNLIAYYNDFDEFYWDVTGSLWNLVIGKMGATITYPSTVEPLGQVALIGNASYLDPQWSQVVKITPTSFGFMSIRPLFMGEGFHIISSLPHGIITAPSLLDKIIIGFERHSDIFLSLMTFLTIVIGFLVSGKYIRKNIGQLKISLKKNAAMTRFLYNNRYDIKSFAAFILELYKKNIIDIQQSGDTILLVKRTDNIKNLSKAEQKAVMALFSNEAVFNVNKNNLIKIKRASKYIEKELKHNLMSFMLKLNSGYVLFSLAMLFVGELFIALFANNLPMISILTLGTMLLVGGCLLFYVQSVYNLYNVAAKSMGTAIILLTTVAMASVISPAAILFILLSIVAILYFTTGYSKRNGLLRPYIEDVNTHKNYLRKHHDTILLGKEIANQQANILVLDMENEFVLNGKNEYYKLSAIIDMIKKLV